ncbi:hypothetical protein D3C75_587860 [compost metagenome]
MFPKPQKVEGSFPVHSASRDPFTEGRSLARSVVRNTVFFGIVAIAAIADLHYPQLGSPVYYGVVAMFSLVPLFATVF